MKDLKYYLGLSYPVTISKRSEKGKVVYVAEVPDLPGCRVEGKTYKGTLREIEEAKRLWIRISLKKNLPMPEPVSEDEFSGRLLLRIPAKLHMTLTMTARSKGLSLNQLIRNKLENEESTQELQKDLIDIKIKLGELCKRSWPDTTSQDPPPRLEDIESRFRTLGIPRSPKAN